MKTIPPSLMSAAGAIAPCVIRPLRPSGNGWRETSLPDSLPPSEYPLLRFIHDCGFQVLSAVEVAPEPEQPDKGPEYHLSFSRINYKKRRVERVTSQEAAFLLTVFGLDGWEEDNHVPGGKARNFWRPVNENLVGLECPCKASEPVISEDKGDYIWRPA